MPTSDLPLSDEQRRAVALAAGGSDGAIVARAGSGKTYTLRASALATDGVPSMLLAFNRVIAREAATRFPAHVRCTTLHALAHRSVVGRDPRMRRKFEASHRWTPDAACDAVGLDPRDPDRLTHLAAIRATLRGFCASDDDAPHPGHLPSSLFRHWTATLGDARARDRRTWVVRRAGRFWARTIDPDDPVPLDHDAYLKAFALGGDPLPVERLWVDEAQDLAPVMLQIVRRQSASRLLVGDPAQRIYGWRGAIDAMAASGYPEVRLTRSFRFGPQIAATALRVLQVLSPNARLVGAGPEGTVRNDPVAGAASEASPTSHAAPAGAD
ncbi:MAG: UvrD-helicase domain-containing protein, partial [Trueperaceae bacterium]